MGKSPLARTRRALGGVLLITLALIQTGCLWAFPRFDVGGTGNNTSETALTMANVAGLHESWTTPDLGPFRSEPLVTSSTVYVASLGASGSQLQAFDLAGVTGCAGAPKVCQPLWTAPLAHYGQPSITGSTLFVSGAAYDISGTVNCAGVPKVCQPLFTTAASFMSTVIAGGLVYATPTITGSDVLAVYDAAGTNGCAGSPKVCAPLRTYRATCPAGETCQANQPVAEGDRVFVPIGANDGTNFTGRVAAFDRNGVTGCSGTPTICQTLWLRTIGAPWNIVASGGRVFTAASLANITNTPPATFRLFALSAADGSTLGSTPASSTSATVVSVGGGLVHVGRGQVVDTFDAACTGTCTPLRFYGAAGAPLYPIIANGLLYSGNQNALKVYDVTGVANCGGTPTPGCAPIANIPLPVALRLSAVQSGRVIFNGDNDQRLHVFSL